MNTDPIDIIPKALIIRHYDGLSTRISKFAWDSFVIWWKNPVWDGMRNLPLRKKMFDDLLNRDISYLSQIKTWLTEYLEICLRSRRVTIS